MLRNKRAVYVLALLFVLIASIGLSGCSTVKYIDQRLERALTEFAEVKQLLEDMDAVDDEFGGKIDELIERVEALESDLKSKSAELDEVSAELDKVKAELEGFKKCTEGNHTYTGEPTYEWSEDHSTCTAKVACDFCDEEMSETVNSVYSDSVYTATFTNSKFAAQTFTVESSSSENGDNTTEAE